MMQDIRPQDIHLEIEALARFMPMHLLLDRDGRVLSIGPTLQRVLDGVQALGARFEELFEVRAPGGAAGSRMCWTGRRTASGWPRATGAMSACAVLASVLVRRGQCC